MPGKTLTVSSGPLSTAEVCAVLERGQGELAGFEEAWPQDISYKATHRKGLPSLAGTKSWEMPRLEVHLTLNSRQVTLAMLTEMLRLAPTVLPTGKVSCWGKFTEEAKYPAEHGFIEAAWDQGAYWLGFRPGEKRSLQQAFQDGTLEQAQQENLAETLRMLSQGIEQARLPLQEVPQEKGRTFRHTAGGRWSFAVSQRDWGPMHYYCELPGISPDDLAGRMETLLTLCASPLPRSYFLVLKTLNPPGAPAYEFACRREWPVKEAEIRAVVHLTASAGLEALRILTRSKAGQAVTLATFALPAPGGSATLSAKVKPTGHELKLKIPAAQATLLPELSHQLGTEFQE